MIVPAKHSPAAYDQLHPAIQRWVYDQGWPALRPVQEEAIPLVLAANRDVVIAAGTAGGKTEAAWLPIFSTLAWDEERDASRLGVKALYIGPLKALIDDQFARLTELGKRIDLPVSRRHGDISGAERDRVIANPDGILMVTPESLEALFMIHGSRVPAIFAGVRYIVVDELHAFIGSERGAQLQSLLHRIELATGRSIPRIALSATLADFSIAADFLRPRHESVGATLAGSRSRGRPQGSPLHEDGTSANVAIVHPDQTAGAELLMQVRGYRASPDDGSMSADREIAAHIFEHFRGSNNLVFANTRADVELFSSLLSAMCEDARVPNEFFAHHGSLSADARRFVEDRLKGSDAATTAICTSTLEMGIDIGSISTVGQIGAPGSVAAVRQRLGRSGRRGDPAVLRAYVAQEDPDATADPEDLLNLRLIQTIAALDLMLEHWLEPPDLANLHLSTLIQQLLSSIAQHGGVVAARLYEDLCATGSFRALSPSQFAGLLRALGAKDILSQAGNGLLLPGVAGEKLMNHYSFYTAFQTTEEFRLVAAGKTLGTLPISTPLVIGDYLIFGGRRWQIIEVDKDANVVELQPAAGGNPPNFGSGAIRVADGVRARMREVLAGSHIPTYLDAEARSMLAGARSHFRHLGLERRPITDGERSVTAWPWTGDKTLATMHLMLRSAALDTVLNEVSITVQRTDQHVLDVAIRALLASPPDPLALARSVENAEIDKHDHLLPDDLLRLVVATRDLDVPAACRAFAAMIT